MKSSSFTFISVEGKGIFTRKWETDKTVPKGIVQIIHGISEHSGRYETFAKFLTDAGYVVYAHDQRGHGKTAESSDNLGYPGENGWDLMVRDVYELSIIASSENPGLPLFMLGHSMGSIILRRYMYQYETFPGIKGFLLSGTLGNTLLMLKCGRFLCRRVIKNRGIQEKNIFIHKLTFLGFNSRFKEKRTLFDWLSRDCDEVDKYINDPLCGQICTVGLYNDFFGGIMEVQKKNNLERIPKSIPVYMFSGKMDPVGRYGKKVTALFQSYKAMGIRDVSYKLYEGGRHEMLNEINRYQVMADILQWLNAKNRVIL